MASYVSCLLCYLLSASTMLCMGSAWPTRCAVHVADPAEVLEIKTDAADRKQYYVHFLDCEQQC